MLKKSIVGVIATGLLIVGGVALLGAQSARFDQVAADPAYIVVNTPTPVTFTATISDSNLRRHDPAKVLLVRTDAAGTPLDIVGRMNDRGKKADANKKDHTYTIQATLNESAIGPVYFRVAAKFKSAPFRRESDDDDDWDVEIGALNNSRSRQHRRDRLPPLLRKLQRYTQSDAISVAVLPGNPITDPDYNFTVSPPTLWQVSTVNGPLPSEQILGDTKKAFQVTSPTGSTFTIFPEGEFDAGAEPAYEVNCNTVAVDGRETRRCDYFDSSAKLVTSIISLPNSPFRLELRPQSQVDAEALEQMLRMFMFE